MKKKEKHKHDPSFHIYNEYISIPLQRKKILRDATTTLDTKIKKINQLKKREQELKNKLAIYEEYHPQFYKNLIKK